MLPQIERLLIIQDRDQTIMKCRKQATAIPKERQMLEHRLEQEKLKFEQSKVALQQNEIARQKLETEEQVKRDAIAKYKTQMLQTRKNEEYQAFMHEIAQAEKAISDLEDKELVLLEELDQIKPQVAEAERVYRTDEKEVRDAITALTEREASLKKRIEEVSAERAQLIEEIDLPLRELYEALIKSKGDAAIVALEHGICAGCHMSTTLTISNAVAAGKEVTQCNNCGRILYRQI